LTRFARRDTAGVNTLGESSNSRNTRARLRRLEQGRLGRRLFAHHHTDDVLVDWKGQEPTRGIAEHIGM
jgi:hypothetical protein